MFNIFGGTVKLKPLHKTDFYDHLVITRKIRNNFIKRPTDSTTGTTSGQTDTTSGQTSTTSDRRVLRME